MEGDTWAMSMSPGPEKAKGPQRIEISGRLMADDIVILEIDLDEGWMTVSVDGIIRAHFTDLHQVKEKVSPVYSFVCSAISNTQGIVLHPAINTCHHDEERYTLLPPHHDLLALAAPTHGEAEARHAQRVRVPILRLQV